MYVLGDNPMGIPFDVKGKSQEELEEMGFRQAGELEFEVDDQGNVQGIDTESAKELMEFLQSLKKHDAGGAAGGQADNDIEEIKDHHNSDDSDLNSSDDER